MSDDLTIFGTVSLGALIRWLERRPSDELCRFDFCHRQPGRLHSYRGFYDHLAFSHGYEGDATVAAVLAELKAATGLLFEGWKGGTYRMHFGTPVWVDDPRDASSTAIVGIADCDYMTVLETRFVQV